MSDKNSIFAGMRAGLLEPEHHLKIVIESRFPDDPDNVERVEYEEILKDSDSAFLITKYPKRGMNSNDIEACVLTPPNNQSRLSFVVGNAVKELLGNCGLLACCSLQAKAGMGKVRKNRDG